MPKPATTLGNPQFARPSPLRGLFLIHQATDCMARGMSAGGKHCEPQFLMARIDKVIGCTASRLRQETRIYESSRTVRDSARLRYEVPTSVRIVMAQVPKDQNLSWGAADREALDQGSSLDS